MDLKLRRSTRSPCLFCSITGAPREAGLAGFAAAGAKSPALRVDAVNDAHEENEAGVLELEVVVLVDVRVSELTP